MRSSMIFGVMALAMIATCISATISEPVVTFHGHKVLRLSLNATTITPTQHAAYFNLRASWGLDFWTDNDVRVAPEEVSRVTQFLREAAIPYKIMVDDVQKLVAREQAHSLAVNAAEAAGNNAALIGKDGTPVPSFFSDYRKLADIWAFVDGLVQQYPSLTKKVQIGSSYQNQSLYVIVISSGKAKDSIYIEGGIHSREWVSHTTVLFTAWSLLSGYGTDAKITTLLDSFDFHINPVTNPDGYAYSWTNDRMWRKTRKPNQGTSCVGTDPNRNWDDHWCQQGADKNPCSDAYCGNKAFSEVEVKAVADYTLKVGNVKGFIDFHAYSQLWMQPYGWTAQLPRDETDQTNAGNAAVAAIKATHGKIYEEGSIYTIIYPASGSSADWGYDVAKVKYPYGVELRDTGEFGFILPANQIVPTGEEILAGITAWATYIAAH